MLTLKEGDILTLPINIGEEEDKFVDMRCKVVALPDSLTDFWRTRTIRKKQFAHITLELVERR